MQQLAEQMRSCVGKKLHALLFSEDFRSQGKALDVLLEAVHTPEDGGQAPSATEAVACLDLLLKWATLRFLETNPTVLLKVMVLVKVSS